MVLLLRTSEIEARSLASRKACPEQVAEQKTLTETSRLVAVGCLCLSMKSYAPNPMPYSLGGRWEFMKLATLLRIRLFRV